MTESVSLQSALELLYSKELNCRIESFWDGGWRFSLGDEMNGFKATGGFCDLEAGASWLLTMAQDHYPEYFPAILIPHSNSEDYSDRPATEPESETLSKGTLR